MALAILEVLVVLRVLAVLSVCLAGALLLHVRRVDGTRHGDVQREGSTRLPQGMATSRAAAGSISSTGSSRSSSAISLTKLRMALWQTMRSLSTRRFDTILKPRRFAMHYQKRGSRPRQGDFLPFSAPINVYGDHSTAQSLQKDGSISRAGHCRDELRLGRL